jgi:hypothetical protein
VRCAHNPLVIGPQCGDLASRPLTRSRSCGQEKRREAAAHRMPMLPGQSVRMTKAFHSAQSLAESKENK